MLQPLFLSYNIDDRLMILFKVCVAAVWVTKVDIFLYDFRTYSSSISIHMVNFEVNVVLFLDDKVRRSKLASYSRDGKRLACPLHHRIKQNLKSALRLSRSRICMSSNYTGPSNRPFKLELNRANTLLHDDRITGNAIPNRLQEF